GRIAGTRGRTQWPKHRIAYTSGEHMHGCADAAMKGFAAWVLHSLLLRASDVSPAWCHPCAKKTVLVVVNDEGGNGQIGCIGNAASSFSSFVHHSVHHLIPVVPADSGE